MSELTIKNTYHSQHFGHYSLQSQNECRQSLIVYCFYNEDNMGTSSNIAMQTIPQVIVLVANTITVRYEDFRDKYLICIWGFLLNNTWQVFSNGEHKNALLLFGCQRFLLENLLSNRHYQNFNQKVTETYRSVIVGGNYVHMYIWNWFIREFVCQFAPSQPDLIKHLMTSLSKNRLPTHQEGYYGQSAYFTMSSIFGRIYYT